MIRARFKANYDDWRPVKWPPPGPCWCSGTAGDESYSIVIAYAKDEDAIREFWPEAADIESEFRSEIVFTDRFPRPDYWPAGKTQL
jgi:hypothetical protein